MIAETQTGNDDRGLPPPDDGSKRFGLALFVSGMTPRSTAAIARHKRICEKHLAGDYDLEVIDIYQQPARARAEQIIATPTLIKTRPAPLRRLVGNLADVPRVLCGLHLAPLGESAP